MQKLQEISCGHGQSTCVGRPRTRAWQQAWGQELLSLFHFRSSAQVVLAVRSHTDRPLISIPTYTMWTLWGALQSFCWRIRWLCRRRGVKPEVYTVVEMRDFHRLLAQRHLSSKTPVSCCVCDNLLCRDSEQFLEHVRGHKHLKRRRALMLDH